MAATNYSPYVGTTSAFCDTSTGQDTVGYDIFSQPWNYVLVSTANNTSVAKLPVYRYGKYTFKNKKKYVNFINRLASIKSVIELSREPYRPYFSKNFLALKIQKNKKSFSYFKTDKHLNKRKLFVQKLKKKRL